MNARSHDDSGLWTLQILLRFRDVNMTLAELRHLDGQATVDIAGMQRRAKVYGFTARCHTTNWEGLAGLPLPGIARLKDGRFLLLGKVNHDRAVILTPNVEHPTVVTRAEFEALWDGRLVLLSQAGALTRMIGRLHAALISPAREGLTTAVARTVQFGASGTRAAIGNLVANSRALQNVTLAPLARKTRMRSDELAFLPAALEIVETPPSPLGRAIAFSIIAVFGAALTWACIGTVDIVAVAPGKIIPSGRTKTIQPFETGVVRAIPVSDGQRVKSGDVLIELDTTAINAELERLQGDLISTQFEIARLTAMISNKNDPLATFTPPANASGDLVEMQRGFLISQTNEQKAKLATIDGQLAQKLAERRTIQASVDKLTATIMPLQQRVDIREQLFQKELGSKLTYLSELQDLVGQRQDILIYQSRNSETNAAISALMETRQKTVSEYEHGLFSELGKAQRKLSALHQDTIKAEQRKSLQRLTAPVDGIVQQLAIHTIGGVVTPAQTLMLVVPAENRLEIEAMISNRDIGFVSAGQEAAVKIDTFNFTRYGLLRGTILNVSQDSIARDRTGENAPAGHAASSEPRGQELLYSARISLDRTQLMIENKSVNLSAGMAVTAEIKTGGRRIISYLLSPLTRYQHDSLRER